MARKWAGKTYHTIRVADPALETRVRIKVSYSPDTGWVNVTDASDYHGQEHPKKIGSQRPTGTYNGDVADVLERVVADPAGALKAYAEITGNCSVCQRPLEDPESILRGMGAICWGKVGGSLPKEYVDKVEAQVKEVTDNA